MRHELHFTDDGVDISVYQFTATRLRVKGAIRALLRAKRHVNIEAGDGGLVEHQSKPTGKNLKLQESSKF
jgi:hypothetical protein